MILALFRGDLPERIRGSSVLVATASALFLAAATVLEALRLWDDWLPVAGFYAITLGTLLASAYHHALGYRQAIRKARYLRRNLPEAILAGGMLLVARAPEALALAGATRAIYDLWKAGLSTGAGRRVVDRVVRTPAQATLVSFAGAILVGTLFLSFPRATANGRGAPLIDALFTATSVTCVTGLVVANTSGDSGAAPGLPTFSLFGQLVILLLIQVGGLGIMTLSTAAAAMLAGGRMTLRKRSLLANVLDEDTPASATGVLRSVFLVTVAFEAVGALILTLRFLPVFPDAPGRAAWYGAFHAVSAFCNAGFSLWNQGLLRFRADPVVIFTLSGLIIAGGLGFAVIAVLFSPATWAGGVRRGLRRLPLHARLALTVTGLLLVAGTLTLLWLDADGGLRGLPWGDRLWAAWFQSVSARTAGFATIDVAATSRAALVVYLFLMFVGASPGGTGGGIKTTTFGLLVLSVRATLRGRADVVLWGRKIPAPTLMKVSVVTLVSFSACLLVSVLLLATQERLTTEQVMFETVSAFGTVGLSLNATSSLDTLGKLAITFLMYLGRVGPLTLTLAIGARKAAGRLDYPEGRVLVG